MIIIFEIKYVSKGGTVVIGGGDHPLANAISIDGLGIPETQYNTVEYIDTAGQSTTRQKDIARIITITGDLVGGQAEIEQFYKAVYYAGELYLTFGSQCRKIPCKIYNAEDMTRHAECDMNGFAVQFIADYPYFTDFENTITYILTKNDLFPNLYEDGEWLIELPAVATETTSEAEVQFESDRTVYPIINILNEQTATQTLSESEGLYIELCDEKLQTRATIELLINTLDNELITIDLPKRQIISDKRGDITNYISDNTVLSDFKLTAGYNFIYAINYNISEKIKIWLDYSPEYLTAVY